MHAPKSTILAPLVLASLSLLLGAPSPARGAASEWSTNEQSRVRLITPYSVAPRKGPFPMGLHFTLSPGWHVYWKNSGDAGFPPVAVFQPAANLGKPELLWPAPRRFDLPGGLVAFGYENEVVYPVRAEIEAAGETLAITADVDYLVCEVDCIPYRYTLSLEQPIGDDPMGDPDPQTAPLLETWQGRLPRPAGQVPGLRMGGAVHAGGPDGPELEIRVTGAQAKSADLFLEPHEAFDAGRPRARATPDGVVFRVPLRPRESGKELPAKTAFAWTVTGLSRDGEPLDLEARREVEVWNGGAPAAGEEARRSEAGLAWMLVLAFVGGALLNLTPTVLALLAVEIPSLRSGGVREGAAAVATGILGACWGVAAGAVAARRAGLAVGWGTQLQEPAVAALLALAAALLTLNLWGLLEAPLAPAGRPSGTGRHLLAGLFTVPLALAWTLTPLSEPVGFALERGPAAVCALFGAIGLGLALPYLILAAVPAAALALPAPGRWTGTLREGLGFLAGASTLWLLYALSRQVSPEGLAWIELILLAMALLAWLRRRADGRSALRFGLALALAGCAAASLWLADDNRLSPRSPSAAGERTQLTTRFTGG